MLTPVIVAAALGCWAAASAALALLVGAGVHLADERERLLER